MRGIGAAYCKGAACCKVRIGLWTLCRELCKKRLNSFRTILAPLKLLRIRRIISPLGALKIWGKTHP